MTNKRTIKTKILTYLLNNQGSKTATDITIALRLRLDSVSSKLAVLVKEGLLGVTHNFGPRGGNGYSFKSGLTISELYRLGFTIVIDSEVIDI
jgi:predicted ArsR family transcriptional regulator